MRLIVFQEEDVSWQRQKQPSEANFSKAPTRGHLDRVAISKYPRRSFSEPDLLLVSGSLRDVPGSLAVSKSCDQWMKAPRRVARDSYRL